MGTKFPAEQRVDGINPSHVNLLLGVPDAQHEIRINHPLMHGKLPEACKAHDPLRAEPVGGDFDRALRVAGAAGPAPAVMASTALLSPFPERTVREHALRAVLAQAAVPEKGELFLADPLTGENPR